MRLSWLLLLCAGCSSPGLPAAAGDDAGPLEDVASQADVFAQPDADPPEVASPPDVAQPSWAVFGESCGGKLGCEPHSYEGPLILSWACYPQYGCTFRCDECPSGQDAGDGGCQVAYLQTAPPVCPQLGGHCVTAAGLDGGPVSLCVK